MKLKPKKMTSYKLEPKWIESLKKPKNYLQKIQQEGKSNLLSKGYPSPRDEEWRFSNLKRLKSFIDLPYDSDEIKSFQEKYPFLNKDLNTFQIRIDQNEDDFDSINLPQGIRLLNNSELENNLGNTLTKCNCKKFWSTTINESSANKVFGIEVKGQNIPPIELILPSNSNSFNSTRIFIKVERNTNLKLIQVILGSKNSAQSNLLEMNVGENSNVEHAMIGLGGGDGNLISNFAIEQDERSNYSLVYILEGWQFSRFEPNILQSKGKAKTILKGLQVSNNEEELSTHSKVRFEGPEGELDQLNKSAANNNSHSLFNGAIQVPRIAQKTQASQLSRNLILSKRAQINTKPELEIIADDVRCTHGATVSQLQEEELFYLRSRGIGSQEAYSLLLEGYYQEILKILPLYSLRSNFLNNHLSKTIE